jgi:two-component system LytT family response regulator
MAIPNSDGFTMVKTADIIYCKADGSYTDIHLLNGKKIVATKLLKDIEEYLPTETFYKIHRSYIVNLNLIKQFVKTDGHQVIMEDGTTLDVSERNKKEFIEKLTNR